MAMTQTMAALSHAMRVAMMSMMVMKHNNLLTICWILANASYHEDVSETEIFSIQKHFLSELQRMTKYTQTTDTEKNYRGNNT
jgi:hypothetical protein